MILYVDTSSLAKVMVVEDETAATTALLASASRLVTSEITGLELRRLHHRLGRSDGAVRTKAVLAQLAVVRVDADLLDEAGALSDPHLRSLDAIHVATALRLGDSLDAVVTHDGRLGDAVEAHGLTVVAPGATSA